jgi:hypothetical protein
LNNLENEVNYLMRMDNSMNYQLMDVKNKISKINVNLQSYLRIIHIPEIKIVYQISLKIVIFKKNKKFNNYKNFKFSYQNMIEI